METYITTQLCTKPNNPIIDELIFDFDLTTREHTLHGCAGQIVNDIFTKTKSFGRGTRTEKGP